MRYHILVYLCDKKKGNELKGIHARIKGAFTDMRPNEIVLLIMTLSIFLTVYIEIAVLMALPIYIFVTKQGFIFRRRRYDVIFLSIFWLLSMVVTLLNKPGALDIAMGVMMVFAFIAMIFTCYAMTQRMFRLIISICCFMSPVCFAIALIQQGMGLVWDYGERYCSVFTNPNYYAFYISLVILFCIYSSIKSEGAGAKAAFLLLIPINLAALYLTECRTTFIVLLAVCPIMLCYCEKKRWLVIYLAVFAAFFTAALLLEDKLELLPRMGEIGADFKKRMDIWKGAIKSIADAPIFGRGYNTYTRIHELYGSYDANHSHNLLLELLMDFGIVGSGILAAYFSINIGKIIGLHRLNKCHHRYGLTVAVLACVALHGLFDITMLWPQTGLLVIYIIGYSTDYDKVHIFSDARRHSILPSHQGDK